MDTNRAGLSLTSPFASAVRGCSLISTVFGSKSPGGGRKGGEEGEGREGGRQDSPFRISSLQSGGRERRERGRRVRGDSLGDVVLGSPRPALDAGETGRAENSRYRHAPRAPAAQGNGGSRPKSVTVR
ncbi:hypothetical protein GOODEAATRI_001550 [Goodea atripinnis]|uniref:Uncharacterized protein n=1 Tax=Goodea atripinnis TaxID=208336 RepID=A0ABV0MNF0_9TELE